MNPCEHRHVHPLRNSLPALVLMLSLAAGTSAAADYASPREAYAAWTAAAPGSTTRAEAREWLEIRAHSASSAKAAAEIAGYLSRIAAATGETAPFAELCRKRAASASPELRLVFAGALFDHLAAIGQNEEAAAALAAVLPLPGIPATMRAAAAKKQAQLLANRLGRLQDGVDTLEAAAKAIGPEASQSRFDLILAEATLLREKDAAKAESLLKGLLPDASASPASLLAAAEQLAMLLAASGRESEIPAVYLAVFRNGAPSAGAARKLAESDASAAQLEEALASLRAFAARPADGTAGERQTRLERLQPEIVELLFALGRLDEAGGECRVLLLAGSDRTAPVAVELAARAFKMADGNLARANALYSFFSSEEPPAGTPSPILGFPSPDRAAWTNLPAAPPPSDWNAWLSRAGDLLWLDRPLESAEAARQAFASCPMTSNTLAVCASAVARPALNLLRDAHLAARLTDYLVFGPAGRDGAKGTDDDISDPFAELAVRLGKGGE